MTALLREYHISAPLSSGWENIYGKYSKFWARYQDMTSFTGWSGTSLIKVGYHYKGGSTWRK